MAYCQSKTPLFNQRRRVADTPAPTPCGDPDLHHPLQYRKQEALWKLHCNLKHREFCACPNFLDHFKWPTGEKEKEHHEEADGGTEEDPTIGESIIGATIADEEDIPDSELLK
uniref:ORF2 n=1 Tax=Torque teno Leptonychotes weddellii virus-1 TaxID=2012676 RepID=A0A1Z2RVG1_9VIRU|nr:ORF2 [Torque teno Leptonychotes weddellii virus 1]